MEIETEAKQMGWVPKEEFRGNVDKWIDAESYVKRGKEVLPILQANNRRLQDDLVALRQKTAQQDNVIQAAMESIEELKKFNSESAVAKAKDKKADLKAQLVKAKKEGNYEVEVELQDQLTELNTAISTAEAEPVVTKVKSEATATTAQPQADPVWQSWVQDNPWYTRDLRRAAVANAVAQELRAADPEMKLKGRAFFDKVTEEVEKTFGGNQHRQAPSKVEGGSRSGDNEVSGKTYNDLPPDAKAACDRQAKKLVGPKGSGRAYETEAAWRQRYAELYDWEG